MKSIPWGTELLQRQHKMCDAASETIDCPNQNDIESTAGVGTTLTFTLPASHG